MFSKYYSLKKFALTTLTLGALAQPAWAVTTIDKCQTLSTPGSYQLSKDLTVTSGDVCFRLIGSNITLDLGGHTVRSINGMVAFGIVANGDTDATGKFFPAVGINVRNGIVADFNDGVALFNTAGAIVEKLQTNVNKSHGLWVGNGAIVRHGRADSNGRDGVTVGAGSFVDDMTIGSNGGVGVLAGVGSRITNVVSDFNQQGIAILELSDVSIVKNNTVEGNKGAGLGVACPAVITNNRAQFFPNGGANFVARVVDVVHELSPVIRISGDECVTQQEQPGIVIDHSKDDFHS